ncbi:GNAT family N-acetyltransferase [Streptomyces sp. NPDC055078]
MNANDDEAELVIREVRELEEFREIDALFGAVWQTGPGGGPISVELIRALSHSGNYVTGAYRGGRMVGASVAFLAAPPGQALHSHVTGVSESRGIGFALKHHQRAWALARGLNRITWTFDPLVRRNAYFNLSKLGATLEEYHTAFYGPMQDGINGADDSDRVLAVWRIDEERATAAVPAGSAGEPPAPVLTQREDGHPQLHSTDERVVLVGLPSDIETLRRTCPAAATAWRLAVREVLGGLLADGAGVVRFHGRTGYVVDLDPQLSPSRRERTNTLESQNR